MKNLRVFHQQVVSIPDDASIISMPATKSCVCYTSDYGSCLMYFLMSYGIVHIFSTIDSLHIDNSNPINLNSYIDNSDASLDNSWFSITFVQETGHIVCVSHNGNIVSIKDDSSVSSEPLMGYKKTSKVAELEGTIDCGIYDAKWNPEFTCLIILTKNDSLLCMTNEFEVIDEITLSQICGSLPVSISWICDSTMFAISCTSLTHKGDADPNGATLKIYSGKDYSQLNTGRNVTVTGTGPAMIGSVVTDGSLVKGLGGVVAFSSNGSYIAVPQQRSKDKYAITLFERNGLTHGGFDLQLTTPPSNNSPWKVTSLHWDISSTLLAVSLISESDVDKSMGIVQIYYRSNYHWYLKQQWNGCQLSCLGFDAEYEGRLFLTESICDKILIHLVDTMFEVYANQSLDCSVGVTDGNNLRLSNLGISTVPPPMYNNSVTLSAPCRHASFWLSSNPSKSGYVSGVVCLSNDGAITLAFLDNKGKPIGVTEFNINEFLRSSDYQTFWSCACTEISSRECQLAIGGTRLTLNNFHNQDIAIIINITLPFLSSMNNRVRLTQENLVSVRHFLPINNRAIGCIAYCQTPLQDGKCLLAIATASSFDLTQTNSMEIQVVDTLNEMQQTQSSVIIPEILVQFNPISLSSSNSGSQVFTFLGLSAKHRLYYGENLVLGAVSSFAMSNEYSMLLVVTLGSKPLLHFLPLEKLESKFKTNIVRGNNDHGFLQLEDDIDDGQVVQSLQCDNSRPVERGSRIIAVAGAGYKVILQMPRGNLEAFEPRVLILLYAKTLLEKERRYYDCLVMLRRQRVDLNLIIDYDLELFVKSIDSMVEKMISNGTLDLMSIFVSSIEEGQTVRLKYPILFPMLDSQSVSTSDMTSVKSMAEKEGKLNFVCRVLRESMMTHLLSLTPSDSSAQRSALLNPILGTYARQSPPLLEDALKTLRKVTLSTAFTDAALKYLAFLAEGQQLFEAALGQCDFEMAKAVARQTQMDPKLYMPLIEGFEILGRGVPSNCASGIYMNYRVFIHLKRYREAVQLAFNLIIKVATDARDSIVWNNLYPSEQILLNILKEVLDIITKNDLFEYALSYVNLLLRIIPTSSASNEFLQELKISIITMTNGLYNSYGMKCISSSKYSEAITSFMSAQPPNVSEAIRAAIYDSNWSYALTLASLYETPSDTSNQGISVRRIANEIVTQFKESLQQSESKIDVLVHTFSNYATISSVIVSDMIDTSVNSLATKDKAEGRALEAARICVDYCQDIENAVTILLLSRSWLPAIKLSLHHNRRDLFHADIIVALRAYMDTVLKCIVQRGIRQRELVEELAVIWKNPEERLHQVSSTDAALLAELKGELGANSDDTKSEYSASSEMSYVSSASRSSTSSRKSGMSSVSILSSLSHTSSSSTISKKSTNNFAIEGLDHTLLSRGGTASKGEGSGRYGKKEKKEQKKKIRGEGRDVWGIRREGQICSELWLLADVTSVAKTVEDLCNVALVALTDKSSEGIIDGRAIACQLQEAMDVYTSAVLANPPPIAPAYPVEWLSKRLMLSVTKFQQSSDSNNSSVKFTSNHDSETWWKYAAEGIQLWRTIRKISLSAEKNAWN